MRQRLTRGIRNCCGPRPQNSAECRIGLFLKLCMCKHDISLHLSGAYRRVSQKLERGIGFSCIDCVIELIYEARQPVHSIAFAEHLFCFWFSGFRAKPQHHSADDNATRGRVGLLGRGCDNENSHSSRPKTQPQPMRMQ